MSEIIFIKEAETVLNKYVELKEQEEEIKLAIDNIKEQFDKWLESNKIKEYILNDDKGQNWQILETSKMSTKFDIDYLKSLLTIEQLKTATITNMSKPFIKISKVGKTHNKSKKLEAPKGE